MNQVNRFFGLFLLLGACIAVITTAQVAAQTCPEGVVSYWKFDEGTGTSAMDSVGTNDGTLFGPTWTVGKIGSAVQFDGITSYIDIPTPQNIPYGNYPWSIEAWINYQESDDYKTIVGICSFEPWYGSTNIQLQITTDGKLWVAHYANDRNTNVFVSQNVWHHVAVTYDGTTEKFYLDGGLVDTWIPGTLRIDPDILRIT